MMTTMMTMMAMVMMTTKKRKRKKEEEEPFGEVLGKGQKGVQDGRVQRQENRNESLHILQGSNEKRNLR